MNGNNKMFGYMRVSSKDQNEARQLKELLDYEIHERDIFMDKQSGKNFERVQYQILRQMLRAGDVLVIKSIDRFGRNYQEILEEWKYIVKDLGSDIVVLDMPILDTRQNKDLLGTLITDIVLQSYPMWRRLSAKTFGSGSGRESPSQRRTGFHSAGLQMPIPKVGRKRTGSGATMK